MNRSIVVKTMYIFENHKWNEYVAGLDYVDEIYQSLKSSLDNPETQHEALIDAKDIMKRYYLHIQEPHFFRELELHLQLHYEIP